MAHILIVDDEPALCRCLEKLLRERGHTVGSVHSGNDALEVLHVQQPDLLLLDLYIGRVGSEETLTCLTRTAPGIPVVLITGQGNIDAAVSALNCGASDFVTKPFNNVKLVTTIESLLLTRARAPVDGAPELIGESEKFRDAMEFAMRFARPDIGVLLLGETGTGKELFARAIHAASRRSGGPFVPVDCSLLSESLIESELFGHEKGSFTGATSTRTGHFERAHGGTLFLDEIGNLRPSIQAKLLRVLQERTMERVGGRETIRLDIRVIAATNIDLLEAARQGTFRLDLYYRLAEVSVSLPPLRERAADIQRIAMHFLCRYARKYGRPARGISPLALEALTSYPWPGNVRELENAIKSAVVLAQEMVQPEHLPQPVTRDGISRSEVVPAAPGGSCERLRMEIDVDLGEDQIDLKAVANTATEQAERAVLAAILGHGRYSHAQLAKIMNVDPKTLRAKLRKYGLDPGIN